MSKVKLLKRYLIQILSIMIMTWVLMMSVGIHLLMMLLFVFNQFFPNRNFPLLAGKMLLKTYAYVFDHWSRMSITLHSNLDLSKFGANFEREKYSLLISNHQSSCDWFIISIMADSMGFFERFRIIAKEELKMMPLYGHAIKLSDGFFIKRGGKQKLGVEQMKNGIRKLIERRLRSWILLFPEGTIYDPQWSYLIDRSQEYCKQNNFVPLTQLLMPRTSGLMAILETMGDELDAIYDLTMVYSSTRNKNGHRVSPPTHVQLVDGTCPNIDIHIERIDGSLIPRESQEALEKWSYERYVKKEESLVRYYKQGQDFAKAFNSSFKIDCKKDKFFERLFASLFTIAINLPLFFNPIGPVLYLIALLIGNFVSYIHLYYFHN